MTILLVSQLCIFCVLSLFGAKLKILHSSTLKLVSDRKSNLFGTLWCNLFFRYLLFYPNQYIFLDLKKSSIIINYNTPNNILLKKFII